MEDITNDFFDNETYVAEMDSETVNQDFDEIDLYGTKTVEEDDDDCNIEFE